MTTRDIIVIGASAGAIAALERLVEALPENLPAAVFVVIHLPRTDGVIRILNKKSRLPVHSAIDTAQFQAGNIYVSPGQSQLTIENGVTRVESSPRESAFQPSINALFRSAASVYGRRVIGVVLTGLMYDGTAGLWQIKKHGGTAVVEDPDTAQFAEMPQSAIDNVAIDYVLPLEKIGEKLVELTREELPDSTRRTAPRVLIVEDERIVAKGLHEHLKALGYQVTGSVDSGERAVEMAAETSPDIVLMDIRLAGTMTGVEAARRIWERSQIPIVYLTAHSDRLTLEQVKTTESYGYIVTPFHSEAVHASIQLALARREKELRQP